MAKFLQLRWTKVNDPGNTPNGYYYDSNLVKLNQGHADIQVQIPSNDAEISYLLSLSGDKFVSIFHDYFGELHIKPIPVIGVGQILKFRVNKLPDNAIIIGDDLEDAGDINPDDPDDILNGFAGSEGEYFRDIYSEVFAGKSL